MWSNRSVDLISKIWGTASSNVADKNLNDLELDILAAVVLCSVSCRACGMHCLYYSWKMKGSYLHRQDAAIDTSSRRRDPCCILIYQTK
jgi:hypothetical protein